MPLITAKEAGGFFLHDEDEWIDGTIATIEETDGQWGPGLKWVIHLDDDTDPINDEPRETWAFSSQNLNPRSKLHAWLKGIDPDAIPNPGDTIDTNDLVGRRIQVMFERYDGTDRDGQPQEKEKVVKIRKGKAPAKRAAAKPKAKVDDYGPDEAPF